MRIGKMVLLLCLGVAIGAGTRAWMIGSTHPRQGAGLGPACDAQLGTFLATGLNERSVRAPGAEREGVAFLEKGCSYGALMVAMRMVGEETSFR